MLEKADRKKLIHSLNGYDVDVSYGFSNFSKNVRSNKVPVIDIENVDALRHFCRTVHQLNEDKNPKNKITFRAVAGKGEDYSQSFSFSPGAAADIVIRLTGEDFKTIVADKEDETAHVGAGLSVGEVDRILYDTYGMVLPTSSLFGYPTTVGLAANAGHGSGREQPGFAGLIEELYICRPDGQLEVLNNKNSDFETLRAAHLGLLGVVISQRLKCIPAHKIHLKRDATNLQSFLQLIDQGVLERSDYFSAMYTPTYRKNAEYQTKDDNVAILEMNRVDVKTPNKNHHVAMRDFVQDLLIDLQEAFQVPDLLVKFPKLIPYYMRYAVSDYSIGKDAERIGPAPEMQHYQTAFPWKIDDADYLFEVSPDGHEVKNALKHVVNVLDEFARRGEYPVTYAIYIRYLQGTNGGLSTSAHADGKKVCGFDIVSDPEAPGYQAFKKQMQDYFINELHAKPHWGKYVPLDVDYAKLYGKDFDEFKAALKRWYKEGDVSLAMSPLLTPFYAKILHMRKYSPKLSYFGKHSIQHEPALDAQELHDRISDRSEYGHKIRQKLAATFFADSSSSSSSSNEADSSLGYHPTA